MFSEYLELDLSTVVPSIAGPKRPQDRIELSAAKEQFQRDLPTYARTEATNGVDEAERASRSPGRPTQPGDRRRRTTAT